LQNSHVSLQVSLAGWKNRVVRGSPALAAQAFPSSLRGGEGDAHRRGVGDVVADRAARLDLLAQLGELVRLSP
jgi:hypothetical protein